MLNCKHFLMKGISPSSFSSGFKPKFPNRRLPPSLFLEMKRRAFLPCFQGHRWLRFRGFCFSIAFPILKPEDHRALPSPGVFVEQRIRTKSLAGRGFISQTSQSPSGEPWQTLTRKTWTLLWKVLASAFQTPFTPRKEIRIKGLLSPWRWVSVPSILGSSSSALLWHSVTHWHSSLRLISKRFGHCFSLGGGVGNEMIKKLKVKNRPIWGCATRNIFTLFKVLALRPVCIRWQVPSERKQADFISPVFPREKQTNIRMQAALQFPKKKRPQRTRSQEFVTSSSNLTLYFGINFPGETVAPPKFWTTGFLEERRAWNHMLFGKNKENGKVRGKISLI